MPATATRTITFRSKHSQLRLVRKSAEQRLNPNTGNVSIVSPEVVYEFKDGVLNIEPGQDQMPDKSFNNDTQEWESQDALEYLRTHPLLDVRFIEVTPIAPDPSVALAAITDALIAGDLLTLEGIGDEEFATFNRPEIMGKVRAAMDSIEARTTPAPDPKAKD